MSPTGQNWTEHTLISLFSSSTRLPPDLSRRSCAYLVKKNKTSLSLVYMSSCPDTCESNYCGLLLHIILSQLLVRLTVSTSSIRSYLLSKKKTALRDDQTFTTHNSLDAQPVSIPAVIVTWCLIYSILITECKSYSQYSAILILSSFYLIMQALFSR